VESSPLIAFSSAKL